VRRLLGLLALTSALGASLAGPAMAADGVTLSGGFLPNRLGASTTIALSLTLPTTAGTVPSPLTKLELRLPAGVTGVFNTLGLATCSAQKLKTVGPAGCPANSLIGRGGAVVAAVIGAGVIYEPVKLSIFMSPATNGHTAVAFYVSGTSPIISQLVFPGLLLGDSGAFGARLEATIPPIPGLPGAPDVAIVSLHATIGPKGITYQKRVGRRTVTFSPEGFSVPSSCPVGGFPFEASFTFRDGSTAGARSQAPCPASR
jgi:hypothetical protein